MAKKSLVIVESPAKAKTIGKYLGKEFEVKACMGHLRDLPKSTMGVDLEGSFDPDCRRCMPWDEIEQGKYDVRYHISRKHPVVASLLVDEETRKAVETLLALIENTVPVQRIWLDAAEGKDAPRRISDSTQSETVKEILMTVYRNMLRRSGMPPDEIRQQLKRTEPFCEFPDLVEALPEVL